MLLFFSEKGELWRKTCEISKCLILTSSHILKRKCIVEEEKALTWKQDPRQPAPARGPPSTRTPGIRFWHPKKDHMGGNLVMSNIFWVADDLCCFVEFQLCKIYDNKKKRMASLLTLVFSLHGLPTNREVDWDKFPTAAIRNFQQRNPLLWTESKRAGIVNMICHLYLMHII